MRRRFSERTILPHYMTPSVRKVVFTTYNSIYLQVANKINQKSLGKQKKNAISTIKAKLPPDPSR